MDVGRVREMVGDIIPEGLKSLFESLLEVIEMVQYTLQLREEQIQGNLDFMKGVWSSKKERNTSLEFVISMLERSKSDLEESIYNTYRMEGMGIKIPKIDI